jgi:NAD(P)-dependent dehydrogenase (short-subunit alcohol dehydrogenase family)
MEITTDTTFIITGGGGGIAGEIARVFAEAGARLALADISEEAVHDRAGELDALAVGADLTRPEHAERMVSATVERFGSVDGLIHTAGGFGMAPADEYDPELYDRLFEINVRTLVVSAAAVLPRLADHGGFVAAFSAMPVWNRSGGGGMSVYTASKAAVAGYLRAVAAEMGDRGIHTAVVYPMGAVDTPDNRESMPDADRSEWVDPVEIGRALLFAATRGPRGRLTELPISVTAKG